MLLKWRKHLYYRKGRLNNKANLAQQFCIELHVPNQDSGRLCACLCKGCRLWLCFYVLAIELWSRILFLLSIVLYMEYIISVRS